MARRPHPVPPRSGARRAARLVLATSVLGLALVSAPLAAGADEGPTSSVPTLAEVLDGSVDGLSAEATTMPTEQGDMGIVVEVVNDSDDPVEVAVPFGTLVVTETEGDQALAVTPPPTPEVIEAAASGDTPTIEFDPGTSSRQLPAYCTELGDGYPTDAASVTPIDAAHPVLAETLRTATANDTDHLTTQDAVWWLTDEPTVPVAPELSGLLEVDTEAFAAAPHRVTPDTGYTPMWMRDQVPPSDGGAMENTAPYDEEAAGILDETFEGPTSPGASSDGGSAAGPILWVALVGLVVVAAVVIATRAGRAQPAMAPALARTAPGWYPDPWGGGGHRYWDGQAWTTRVMGSR